MPSPKDALSQSPFGYCEPFDASTLLSIDPELCRRVDYLRVNSLKGAWQSHYDTVSKGKGKETIYVLNIKPKINHISILNHIFFPLKMDIPRLFGLLKGAMGLQMFE
jgi:hypothetical protein